MQIAHDCCMKSLVVCAALLLAGCMLRFEHIAPIPTDRDFSDLDCPALATEKTRIEAGLQAQIKQHDPGTKRAVGVYKGQAEAVNAVLRVKQCAVALVVVPSNKPLSKP
jgi:hypothetical protein